MAAASRTKIIDSDVHPWINGDVKGLTPYMSTAWQRRFEGSKSTDYPHWDTDSPKNTFRRVPDEMKQRIFYDNAAELYGLGTPARV